MRAVTQMVSMKILASLTLPINSMVAFRLEGGGFGVTSFGWDSASTLAQALCSAQMLGEVLLCLPPMGV